MRTTTDLEVLYNMVWTLAKVADPRRFQRKLEAAGGEYVLARGVEDVEHLAGEKQLSLDRR